MGKIKIIGGLIVVLATAAIAFLLWLDPNAYKEPISQVARAFTERQLELAGEHRLRMGFTPSVTIDKVRFANAPWGSRPHMVKLDRLTAELELWPLLFGEIKISRVVVTGADILLEKDSNGRGNWQFEEPAATTQAPETEADAPVLPTFQLVVIEKSRLIYRERPGAKTVTVALDRLEARSRDAQSPLRLSLDGAYNGQPFSIEGELGALAGLSGPKPWPLDIKAVAGGATVTVNGTIAEPLVGNGVKITVFAAGKDLSGLSGLAGTPLPAIGPYKLDASLRKNGKTIGIKDLKLDLGNSRMRGDISVKPEAAPPRITASFTAPLLDLADFTAPSKGESAQTSSGSGRLFSARKLPLDTLRVVAGDVTFSAARIKAGGLVFTETAVHLVLGDVKVTLKPLRSRVAGGTVMGSATVAAGRGVVKVDMTLDVAKLDLGPALTAMKVTDMVSGKLDIENRLAGSGRSVRAIMAGLGGRTSVVMGRGTIHNRYVNLVGADLLRVLVPDGSAGTGARVNCLVSRFTVNKGIATSRALLFDTGLVTVGGTGAIDLRAETLDLKLFPKPKHASLLSLAVPINVGGTLASPSAAPDTAAVAKGVAGALLGGMINPLGILVPLVSGGSDDRNPCLAALAQKPLKPTQKKIKEVESSPIGAVGQTMETIGNSITDGLKGLFGK